MEHRQSETKYPLEVFLEIIQSSALFVLHLFVDLEGYELMDKEEDRELTSFSPNENTGTRSALMRSDRRMLGTREFYIPMHHRHLDEPHSTGNNEKDFIMNLLRGSPILKGKVSCTRMCTETFSGATYDDAYGVSGAF
jgi:hypothetical protein